MSDSEQPIDVRCERCGHRITHQIVHQAVTLKWYALSALLMLAMSMLYSFLGFSAKGVEHRFRFTDTIEVLLNNHFVALGILLSLLLILPVIYLLLTLYASAAIEHKRTLPGLKLSLRMLWGIEPWLMMDVFLVGILVALIKLHSMAQVEFGLSFWPFCLFVVLLVKTLLLCDRVWLWNSLFPQANPESLQTGVAHTQGMTVCHCCGAVSHGLEGYCPRCSTHVQSRTKGHQKKTVALLIASCVMFIPANWFPIMDTAFLGSSHGSTILGGVILLWATGSYPIALVVFVASVVVPIFKILLLSWLCWQSRHQKPRSAKQLQHFYFFTEFIGRWSMIDIFVVAILTALVQLGSLMRIIPGPAIIAFASVVVLTMLAAQSFDPRSFWDTPRSPEDYSTKETSLD
ncbi:PqiA/YebS family transporter subunit [Vibrio tritonius]|uniref:PqiA/YebS family transporter subunit n=1 Tax=Vibrio tritonius TaxID=1435069 RepID=A0ABS7YTH3_9VIBR|nr:PqiA/YebS family transporter subunit [Vibrio tritonius]MCA2018989.1 PqiA/YebS family transporter subunit [Vibrio tritonius]